METFTGFSSSLDSRSLYFNRQHRTSKFYNTIQAQIIGSVRCILTPKTFILQFSLIIYAAEEVRQTAGKFIIKSKREQEERFKLTVASSNVLLACLSSNSCLPFTWKRNPMAGQRKKPPEKHQLSSSTSEEEYQLIPKSFELWSYTNHYQNHFLRIHCIAFSLALSPYFLS